MKNFKTLIASSLLLLAIILISAPSVSYAKNKKMEDKIEVEHKNETTLNKRFASLFSKNSFFSRISPFSKAKKVTATTNLAPMISGIKAPTVLRVDEVGTWIVKASDPQNGSLEYDVDFGDDSSKSLSRLSSERIFVQTSTFTHSYSKAGQYTVTFIVKNEAGLTNTSTVTVHVRGKIVNVQAPVISDVNVTATSARKALVTWKTDVKANTRVWYSKTSPVSTTGKPIISRSKKVLDHSVSLSKLEPNTKYFLVIGSGNNNGLTKSKEISFTTPDLVNNVPVITSLSGSTSVTVGEIETITISAYDPKNGSLVYSADWGDTETTKSTLDKKESIFVQTATLSHVYNTPGKYKATFTVENEAGQKASSTIVISVSSNKILTLDATMN